MTFYVGQMCECIGQLRSKHGDVPGVGSTYTVRGYDFDSDGYQFILLVEIVNPEHRFDDGSISEICFDARAFRPLVEKGTGKGVALLKEIVEGTKHPVSAHHPEGVV